MSIISVLFSLVFIFLSFHRVVVFVSAYVALMLNDGLLYNMGVLFVDMLDTFNVTRAQGVVVHTVMVTITFASGTYPTNHLYYTQ